MSAEQSSEQQQQQPAVAKDPCSVWTVTHQTCRLNSKGDLVCRDIERKFRQCAGRPREELRFDEAKQRDEWIPMPLRGAEALGMVPGGEVDAREEATAAAEVERELSDLARAHQEVAAHFAHTLAAVDEMARRHDEIFRRFFAPGPLGRVSALFDDPFLRRAKQDAAASRRPPLPPGFEDV